MLLITLLTILLCIAVHSLAITTSLDAYSVLHIHGLADQRHAKLEAKLAISFLLFSFSGLRPGPCL